MGACEHIIRERYKVEMPIEDLIADHRRRLIALLEADLVVTPAAIETVCEIKKRGRLVAVATNSPFEYAERVLQLSGLSSLLDTLATGEDATQPKPAPDVYLVATARLSVPPSRCLAVEDSPPGQTAALRAGMSCAVIPNDFLPQAEFSPASPRFPTLHAFREALDGLLAART